MLDSAPCSSRVFFYLLLALSAVDIHPSLLPDASVLRCLSFTPSALPFPKGPNAKTKRTAFKTEDERPPTVDPLSLGPALRASGARGPSAPPRQSHFVGALRKSTLRYLFSTSVCAEFIGDILIVVGRESVRRAWRRPVQDLCFSP